MRLARYPLDFRRGDVLDREALLEAARDCDVVFHCAYGTTGSQRQRALVNREGTQARASRRAGGGARRLVHLSTLMVYGRTADGDLDESAPRSASATPTPTASSTPSAWSRERAPRPRQTVVCCSPPPVFGPYGGVWTERVLGAMKSAGKSWSTAARVWPISSTSTTW
jgi:nucleoside-diphosphate-sugar epimerase